MNQGRVAHGQAIDEQLQAMGLQPSDLDYVLLTHLDCDHANGLRAVASAKHILCAPEEMECARKNSLGALSEEVVARR